MLMLIIYNPMLIINPDYNKHVNALIILEKTTIGSEADVVVEENLPLMGAEPKGGKEKRRRLLRQPNTEAH